MKKPLFILSPCGTSLLSNQAIDAERRLVGECANIKQFEQIPQEYRHKLQALVNRAEKKLKNADIASASCMSAELNGIIKYYGGQLRAQRDHHVLLCTDTWIGEKTANLVAEWLGSNDLAVEVKRQIDLQTEDIASFQCGLSEIVKWCDETIHSYRKAGYHIVFNLTGGFKSVQGFLQTLATFYADEAVYIFETAKELLRIPRLPVEMAAEGYVRKNLITFRRLSKDLSVTDASNIPETLLLKINGSIALSPWGDLVWQQTRRKIYSQELLPSPSEKLRFSGGFERSVGGIPADRLILVNERIDQMARFLETNGEYNPPSLDFKKLRGSRRGHSTHEVDAWADRDAKRIYGHYEGGEFVIDTLGDALH
jgi:putative CRISPR-associated protein (TIGR02619 family)|tara:strand:+ start:69 stop:1172 length:1104 start_codon:yes stop_codon:yes gene_type:complete